MSPSRSLDELIKGDTLGVKVGFADKIPKTCT